MSFTVTGIIRSVEAVQPLQNGKVKRGFVIGTTGDYPKMLYFELYGDDVRVGQVDKAHVGSECEVSFDVQSREYNGKYYTNLSAWKVKVGAKGGQQRTPEEVAEIVANARKRLGINQDEEDKLPF